MLKPGDIVNLVYYDGEGQVEAPHWLVEEYDNGLLKVTREPGEFAQEVLRRAGREPAKKETIVFNLRSIGFLKAELVE